MIKKLNKYLLINKLKHYMFNKNLLFGIIIGILLPIMIFPANMLRGYFSFKINGNENLLTQEERRKSHVVESEPVVLQMVDYLNRKNFSLSKLIENNSFLEMLKELHTNLVPFQPHPVADPGRLAPRPAAGRRSAAGDLAVPAHRHHRRHRSARAVE